MRARQHVFSTALVTVTASTVLIAGATHAAQRIRLGTPVDPQPRDAVPVLRLYVLNVLPWLGRRGVEERDIRRPERAAMLSGVHASGRAPGPALRLESLRHPRR